MRLSINAVIFDMDGVLLDSEPLHEQVTRSLLAECGVTTATGDPYVGMTTREFFTLICREFALPHDPVGLDARYTARVIPLLRAEARPLPGVPDVAVVSAADLPRGKPAPDVFLEAARRLDVVPEACVVIEDSERGVQAARAAGMRCVAIPCGVTRHHDFATATLVLGGLPQVLDSGLFATR